jgi:hypothetical protein
VLELVEGYVHLERVGRSHSRGSGGAQVGIEDATRETEGEGRKRILGRVSWSDLALFTLACNDKLGSSE